MKRLQEENTALRQSLDESYIDRIDFTAAKLLAYTDRKLLRTARASRLEGMRQLEAMKLEKEHADEALLAQKSEAALAEATASQQLKELSTQNVQAEHTIMAERKAAENRQQIIQKQELESTALLNRLTEAETAVREAQKRHDMELLAIKQEQDRLQKQLAER